MSAIDDLIEDLQRYERQLHEYVDALKCCIGEAQESLATIGTNDTHPCEYSCWHEGISRAQASGRQALYEIEAIFGTTGAFDSENASICAEIRGS